jgi:putative ABC transport system permease protein
MVRYLRALWRNLLRRDRVEAELDEELRGYFAMGGSGEYEGVAQVKERVRDVRAGASLDTLAQDVRYAVRTLVRSRGFTAVAVATLALGIGANTAIFTVVEGVLLKPLPYPEPDRLAMLWERQLPGGSLGTVAPANFYDWRRQSRSFSRMAAIDPYPDFILEGAGEPRRLAGAAVSGDFFRLFGVRMALGRDFAEEEDRPGRNRVVILSHPAFDRAFGGQPGIVGRAVTLNDARYTVVGVLPRDFTLAVRGSDFQGRTRFDVFTPLALESPPPAWQRSTHPLCVFARLRDGVPPARAQSELDRIADGLQRLYPAEDREKGIAATPLAGYVVVNVRTALWTLLAAVGMVFLIACANIANLLLARASAREREMGLRLALGASRWRLARQLLTEGMILALAGGAAGVAVAILGVPAMVRALPADLPRAAEIAVDGRVLAFTSLIAIATGIFFSLVPLSPALHRRGTAGSSRMRNALVVGQVAAAVVLLTGAGLMAKSLWRLLQVSPGFRVERILTARLSLPPRYTNGYRFGTGQHRAISALQRDVLERVRAIPGVEAAAFTAYLPLSGTDNSWAFAVEGRAPKAPGEWDVANYRPVSEGYFETLGIPVERGRGFDRRDTEDARLVVAVNRTMARAFWGELDPIGQRVDFGDGRWRTIVGVVGDVRHEALGEKPEPELYVPYRQVPNVEARPTIVIRSAAEAGPVAGAVRRAVAEVAPDVPLDSVETMREIVAGSVGQARFRTVVLLAFALLAMAVASVGIYGVMSYGVSRRTREFGIRLAVGASRGAVLRLVLGQAAKLAGWGIAIGLAAAAMAMRAIAGLLFRVSPFDADTAAAAVLLLAAVSLVAGWLPARRAARTDPAESLRCE